jgi:hypothetical protein
MLAIQSNKELMELFLWSTRNVVEPLGFEISIFGCKFVLETTLLFLNLQKVKPLKDIVYDIVYDIVRYDIIYDVVYDILYDILRYDVVYDIVYDTSRYDVVYDIVYDFLYLGLVAWLYPTLGVQMFASCCFHSCLHFFFVSVRIRYISPVKILVWTFADRALSCVAHSRGCHLRPVQDKDVIKRSAQPNTIVCITKIDIPRTQIV